MAEQDLSGIHLTTSNSHSIAQADRYLDFLGSEMAFLAENPSFGKPIELRPGRFSYIARWKGAKAGHRIVFELQPDVLYVVRILHTAMNLIDYIPADLT